MVNRLENENEEQFLWRIGQLKDSGAIDLSWAEIADALNKEFRDDISEYRSEAAYRKPYQQAKRFYESGVFRQRLDDSYLEELRIIKQELRKEKQKISDERTALNKILRENARSEEDLSKLELLIKENGKTALPEIHSNIVRSDNDLFISLSDFHLGQSTSNRFGSYNSDIAARRLSEYLQHIIKIREVHNSENAYVGLLGDLINGEIHFTTQLESRENITEQVQKSGELISSFIYELSKHFKMVYVNGVAGNHSRTSYKDQALRGNRLDNLIPWYMKAKLQHLSNVRFVDEDNYDYTIGTFNIRNHEYLIVHGDFDSFNESGVCKLAMLIGHKPDGVFYGHLHHCSYDDIAGVRMIRSGSFSGASDDYTISKRIAGNPQQMVCVIDNLGISAFYPVDLK